MKFTFQILKRQRYENIVKKKNLFFYKKILTFLGFLTEYPKFECLQSHSQRGIFPCGSTGIA